MSPYDNGDHFEQAQPVFHLHDTVSRMPRIELDDSPTSPYALTVAMLMPIRIAQNIKLNAQPGKLLVQYFNTSCKATRSEAVETASLNQ